MISNRPYLLRAFYQWITDSNCNPILVINANNPRCKIPRDFLEGSSGVTYFGEGYKTPVVVKKITNELIEFKVSFPGVIHIISAPIEAVLAVYAEENWEGIFFDADEADYPPATGSNVVRLDKQIKKTKERIKNATKASKSKGNKARK